MVIVVKMISKVCHSEIAVKGNGLGLDFGMLVADKVPYCRIEAYRSIA